MNQSAERRASLSPGLTQEQLTATRRLCAGAYADPAFRALVIRKVHNDPGRRVATSYGFDLVAVVQCACRAWAFETGMQVLLLAVIGAAIIVDRPAAVVAACAVWAWWLVARLVKVTPELALVARRSAAARAMRRPAPAVDAVRLRELTWFFRLSVAGSALAGGIGVLAIRGGHISPAGTTITAGIFVAAAALVVAVTRAIGQVEVNSLHRAGSLRRGEPAGRAKVIGAQQDCIHVVYRRSAPEPGNDDGLLYQPVPFTGAGLLVHRWLPPLGVQLLRPGEGPMKLREHTTPPFLASELINHLMGEMRKIGEPDEHYGEPSGTAAPEVGDGEANDPARRVPLRGLRVRPRLFIAEEDVDCGRSFLRTRTDEDINKVIDDPYAASQHFLEMQVSTTGEIVTTAFLRATVRGRSLSLDFTACALTRTPGQYGTLDEYGESGTGAVIRSALRGIAELPASLAGSWQVTKVPWIIICARRARIDRTMIPKRGKRIGARVSVREHAADPWSDAIHDHVGIYDVVKIIEKRILQATQDFLETKEVDTALFKRLTLSIINTGFLNMGRLDVGKGAFGQDAQFHDADAQPANADAGAGSQGE